MNKNLKIICISLLSIAIYGCANKENKSTYKPHIVIFEKSLNNKYSIVNESFVINKNNDRLEYVKNETGEIVIIKKISAVHDYKTCKELADNDYSIAREEASSRSLDKKSSFQQDGIIYFKTEYFRISYSGCLNNEVKSDVPDQKLYKYEITFGNFDVMPDVIEREPEEHKVSKSYSEETFGKVGQFVVIPFVVAGVIILSPFYVIQYISK